MTELSLQKIAAILSDLEDKTVTPEMLSQPEYQDMVKKIQLANQFLEANRDALSGVKVTKEELEAFKQRALPYHQEYDILQYILAFPEQFDHAMIQIACEIAQARDAEENQAIASLKKEELFPSLNQDDADPDEIRSRLSEAIVSHQNRLDIQPLDLHFARSSKRMPLKAMGISPDVGKMAAAGGGEFRRVTLTGEGFPVEVELTHFGEQTSLHLKTSAPPMQEGMVAITFRENESELFTVLIALLGGKGKQSLGEVEHEQLAHVPDEEIQMFIRAISLPYSIAMTITELIPKISQASENIQVLLPLISSGTPAVRRVAICLIGVICGNDSFNLLKSCLEDEEESVRKASQYILSILDNG